MIKMSEIPTHESISISYAFGCDKKCTFCANDSLNRYRKYGEVISIPYETIQIQIRNSNKKYIALCGSHLDLYNYKGMNILHLYKRVKSEFPDKIFFGNYIQPSSKHAKEFIKLLDTKDIFISAYSMDNKVLKAMKVGHTREDVLELIEECKIYNKTAMVCIIDGCYPQSYFDYLRSKKELKSDENVSWLRLKYHKRGNATLRRSLWYALACETTKLFKLKKGMKPISPTINTASLLTSKNIDLLVAMFSTMMEFTGQVPEPEDQPSEEQLIQFFSMMHLLHIPQDALPPLKDYKIKDSHHTLKSLNDYVKRTITSIHSCGPSNYNNSNTCALESVIKHHNIAIEWKDRKQLLLENKHKEL